jgi:hypothetical protein
MKLVLQQLEYVIWCDIYCDVLASNASIICVLDFMLGLLDKSSGGIYN